MSQRQYDEINGAPAAAEDLARALTHYGHFTHMQVRGNAVRGLDLHLERLEGSTRELFGTALDGERVRAYVRGALRRSSGDASVRVGVFPGDPAALMSGAPVAPEIMVSVRPPVEPGEKPQRLRSVEYERLLPHIKHYDTMGLIHHGRRARQDGYDDALFTDRAGRVTEASIANVCFHDGERFVWPDAPALPGVMRAMLRRGMTQEGVPAADRTVRLAELPRFSAAFLVNSIHPALPVAAVDRTAFPVTAEPASPLRDLLLRCYEANPWQPV